MLLSKLDFYGITGIGKLLYKSYLNGIYQKVFIYNKKGNHSTISERKFNVEFPGCFFFI
jgi:hypothetical protein